MDNLEDLHQRIDGLQETISALFRLSPRDMRFDDESAEDWLPFSTRFAFPSELLMRLRLLTANPEKDFLNHLVIKWTARELITLAGHRLRSFLDVWFTPSATRRIGLPSNHDPNDREAADRTLRAVLPYEVRNGFGTAEDPIAYLMRHTQLLPRHLILILNYVLAKPLSGRLDPDHVPTARSSDGRAGVKQAEHTIVEGILSSYRMQFPNVSEGLTALKNRLPLEFPMSEFHREFNRAGIRAKIGVSYEEFVEQVLAVGAVGVSIDSGTERYVRGEFAYTFSTDLSPVEDRDALCIHPLFMYRLFDLRKVTQLAAAGARAVYPYGSDPDDDRHLEVVGGG